MYRDVCQRNVAECDKRISLAGHQRVEEASWTCTTARLILLLRADVDGPPDRLVHNQVFVADTSTLATGAWQHRLSMTRVVLDIDRLEWMVERVVAECDVTDAGVGIMGNYTSDRHTDSKPDVTIAHNDVLRALRIFTGRTHVLNSHGIVIVCDVEALNNCISAAWVQPISVKCVSRQSHTGQQAVVTLASHEEPVQLKLAI